MRLLTICGSLRADSGNRRLLEALSRILSESVETVTFDDLRVIPAFEPDEEAEGKIPPEVETFRRALVKAEAVVISSPEYAHGVVGSLKNALDWVVGSGELSGKPVALLDAAPHARFARAQLHETLQTMDARVLDPVTLAGLRRGATVEEILNDEDAAAAMREMIAALADAAEAARERRRGLGEGS